MQAKNQAKKVERLGGGKIRGLIKEGSDEQLEFVNHF